MITRGFHAWERRLASVDQNRVVRPFEWGLDWLGLDPSTSDIRGTLARWSAQAVADSDRFFAASPADVYERRGDVLRFPSAIVTRYPSNNTVVARIFQPQERPSRPRRAVIVLPQWNADPAGHVGLCRLFAKFGLTAIRLRCPITTSAGRLNCCAPNTS